MVVALFRGLGPLMAASVAVSAAWGGVRSVEAQAAATPPSYQYIIVGAGTAGHHAFKQLRRLDKTGSVLIIGQEEHAPYTRPPLSKELWEVADDDVAEKLTYLDYRNQVTMLEYATREDYEELGADLILGHSAVNLDTQRKIITLDDGRQFVYGKCLLALGGSPRTVAGITPDMEDKITSYRRISDFQKMDAISRQGKTIAVIGGSFLGTEITYSLSRRVKQFGGSVLQVFPEPGIMARAFPRYLSEMATQHLKEETDGAVTLIPNRMVMKLNSTPSGKIALHLDSDEVLEVDHVVLALGITPNTQLAKTANLEIDKKNGGIVVNSELEACSGVYAAGDCASFFDPLLGRRRVEHHDHAVVSGRLAGANMAGANKPFTYQSMFWGDIGTLGYEALGIIDSQMDTVAFWENLQVDSVGTPWYFSAPEQKIRHYGQGTVYFLKDNRVRGVILWNNYGKIKKAREVLGRSFTAEQLREKIPFASH